jgi:glucose-6-phosphate 1-dehydrogenase
VPETLSIEGRAGFYDHTGAYRDMIVTHLFQVLGFVAMQPPASFDARHLREETARVFDAVKPIDIRHVVRGQYTGYTGEPGVAPGSRTETLAAVRAEIGNWRWAGVPFLLRSGSAAGGPAPGPGVRPRLMGPAASARPARRALPLAPAGAVSPP